MIITNDIFKGKNTVSNINAKISREVKKGNLVKLKNGLYETDKNTPGYLLATSIYGPSYLSFDYALFYYGLIPEKVVNYTCATLNKKKKKIFKNAFGTYIYRDIPKRVYNLEVNLVIEGNYSYQIASKEKALCDKLYTLSPLKNQKELNNLLFNDLRIDEYEFKKLDYNIINKLANLYNSTNIKLLAKFMRRYANE